MRQSQKFISAIDSLSDTSGSDDFHGIRIIYHVKVVGGYLRPEPSGSTDLCQWHELDSVFQLPLGDLAETGVRLALRESTTA
ncbi:MAG: hypothetical protein K8U03_11665 [Planctomycetia bacterium]|nr:hypothetical protein [Planctomycetia bacterium]